MRNVLIAAGNSGDSELVEPIKRHLGADSALVRAMAVWALQQLLSQAAFSALRSQWLLSEDDEDVSREWRPAGHGGGLP